MNRVIELQAAIETLRSALHELVASKEGNFADPEVAKLSRKLDELIVEHELVKDAANKEKRD